MPESSWVVASEEGQLGPNVGLIRPIGTVAAAFATIQFEKKSSVDLKDFKKMKRRASFDTCDWLKSIAVGRKGPIDYRSERAERAEFYLRR